MLARALCAGRASAQVGAAAADALSAAAAWRWGLGGRAAARDHVSRASLSAARGALGSLGSAGGWGRGLRRCDRGALGQPAAVPISALRWLSSPAAAESGARTAQQVQHETDAVAEGANLGRLDLSRELELRGNRHERARLVGDEERVHVDADVIVSLRRRLAATDLARHGTA